MLDQLNQSQVFAAHFLADQDSNGLVRIRSRGSGAGRHLHVQSALAAAFGPNGVAGHGIDADYRLVDAYADVRELGGGRIHALAPTVLAGDSPPPVPGRGLLAALQDTGKTCAQ